MKFFSKKISIIFLVVTLIALSFFRESVFVNINAHMWYLFYHGDKSHLSSYISFLLPLSYAQLYWFKWMLTLFFAGMFLIMSCLIIKIIFVEKKFIRWTIYSFLTIIIVSGLCYATGIIFHNAYKGYIFSRFFMGMLQSPFILMVLIPAYFLEKRNAADNESIQISE